MNIAQAKQIALPEFLRRLGYEPIAEKKGQLWYLSPFRHETEPSFKVNPNLNAWYDFAEGKGGDIIDFVKTHQHARTVSDALQYIRRAEGSDPLPKQVPLTLAKHKPAPAITLDSVGPVKSKALLAYLKCRGIALPLAVGRVSEAHYVCDDKKYFGLAFANDSGGYELRNQMWKGTLGTKDITSITGNSTDDVAVFEGFFDYLTAVTINGGALTQSAIILNSVAFRERACEQLKQWKAMHVDLYRDNDTAGASLLTYFENELPDTIIADKASTYVGHSDLNEWHAVQGQVFEASVR